MKPTPKRVRSKEGLMLRRAVAGRLQLIVAVVGKKYEVANIMGISRSKLSNWISDDDPNLPSVEPLIKLCEATGCTLDYIFRGVPSGLTADLAGKLREKQAEVAARHGRKVEPIVPPLKVVNQP